MHPVITQAIAAEQTREMQAYAAAAGRARQLRRSRRTPLLLVAPRPSRRPVPLPALRPMRGPRAA